MAKKKENERLKHRMTRMNDTMKQAIQDSADINNKGVFDKELRELVRIGLKHRKSK